MKIQIAVASLMLLVIEPAIGANYDITINLRGGKNCPSFVKVATLCKLNNVNQADLACPEKADKIIFKLTGKPNNNVKITWPGIAVGSEPLINCVPTSSGSNGANRTITCDYNNAFALNTVAKYTVQYTNASGVRCDLDPRIIITETRVERN
jgi:hypothetical protein